MGSFGLKEWRVSFVGGAIGKERRGVGGKGSSQGDVDV